MTFYLNLFTDETWSAFRQRGAQVSGFSYRQRKMAKERVKVGDIFLCYMAGPSRWCGALKITSEAFEDDTPIFRDPDPFVIRFEVEPLVMLNLEKSIPIFEDHIWSALPETKDLQKMQTGWATAFRGSLREMDEESSTFLLQQLEEQSELQKEYPLTDRDRRQLARKRTVSTPKGAVTVVVPSEDDDDETAPDNTQGDIQSDSTGEVRQSIQVQARLAQIGALMDLKVWIPRSDRGRVSEVLSPEYHSCLLDLLPLNYDESTLDTIEQIDVIWLRGRSIVRAFEVEHTTAIYSGLLRMADLLALQPNMDIRLHIVAPEERRSKVFREMLRPVFSLLERGPLATSCSYLSYDSVDEVANLDLEYMKDNIIEKYSEEAEIDD